MKIAIKKTNIKTRINENFMDKFHKTGILKKTSKLAEDHFIIIQSSSDEDNVKSLDSGLMGLAEETSSKEAGKMIKEKKIDSKVSSMAREKILEFTRAEISSEVENYSKEKTKNEVAKWTDIKIKKLEKKVKSGR